MTTDEARERLGVSRNATLEEITIAHARLRSLAERLPSSGRDAFCLNIDEARRLLLTDTASPAGDAERPLVTADDILILLTLNFRRAVARMIVANAATAAEFRRWLDSASLSHQARAQVEAWLEDARPVPFSTHARNMAAVLVRMGPLYIIVAGFIAGMIWAPPTAGSDYFVAAAGVIPVLILALAVEARILRLRWVVRFRRQRWLPDALYDAALQAAERAGDRSAARLVWVCRHLDMVYSWARAAYSASRAALLAAAVLIMLCLSEWDCMRALASIAGSERRNPAPVSAGILAGLVGVSVVALVGLRDD